MLGENSSELMEMVLRGGRKPVCYSKIDVQVSLFVFAEVLCPLLHVPEDGRRHKLSQSFWEVFITPTYMFDSLIRRPLGDPSSFTSPSRRLGAALIAANTEAGEKAPALWWTSLTLTRHLFCNPVLMHWSVTWLLGFTGTNWASPWLQELSLLCPALKT